MEREYIGVDLHKQFFQACAIDARGSRVWERRFSRDAAGLEEFVSRVGPPQHIAVEACGPTWPFVDAIVPSGAQVCVVDPRKTKLKAGYAAKTDRLDARRLADALRRESVVSIYVPPPAVRELREVCRGRHQLVRIRTRVVQMIRSLLLRNGAPDVPVTRIYRAPGIGWLRTVALPVDAGNSLRRLVRVLESVQDEMEAVEELVRTRAADDAIARALDTVVGIGPVLALTIRAEIGDIHRFPHGRELASYAGLVPRVDSSADQFWRGPITREGAPWLRWALVEAAIHGIRRRDGIGRWARRLAVRRGGAKARVAVARRLCDDVLRVWVASE